MPANSAQKDSGQQGGATASTAAKESSGTPLPEDMLDTFADGDLGRIQSILFGSQAEETERRLSALEASTNEMVARIAGELGSRISSLEADMAHRHQLLEERLAKAGKDALADTAKLKEQVKSETKDIRAVAAAQKADAEKAMENLRAEIEQLRSDTDRMADTKVDRTVLSEAFAATASTLAAPAKTSDKGK